jgi:hypothetical protein
MRCATPDCCNDGKVSETAQPICDTCWHRIVKLVPGFSPTSVTPPERSAEFSVAMDAYLAGRGGA